MSNCETILNVEKILEGPKKIRSLKKKNIFHEVNLPKKETKKSQEVTSHRLCVLDLSGTVGTNFKVVEKKILTVD